MEVVFHIMMFVIPMKIVHRVLMNQCVHRVYNRYDCCNCNCWWNLFSGKIFVFFSQYLLEFTLHQRTQQENRKKPSVDVDSDTNTDLDDVLDEIGDEDSTATTIKSITKSTSTKSSLSKSKSKNREGMNFRFDVFFLFK